MQFKVIFFSIRLLFKYTLSILTDWMSTIILYRKNVSFLLHPFQWWKFNVILCQWTHRLYVVIATIRARDEKNYSVDPPACQQSAKIFLKIHGNNSKKKISSHKLHDCNYKVMIIINALHMACLNIFQEHWRKENIFLHNCNSSCKRNVFFFFFFQFV